MSWRWLPGEAACTPGAVVFPLCMGGIWLCHGQELPGSACDARRKVQQQPWRVIALLTGGLSQSRVAGEGRTGTALFPGPQQ